MPTTSSRFAAAQVALARLLLKSLGGADPGLTELTGASDALEAVAGQLEGIEMHQLRAELLEAAARFVESGGSGNARILGRALTAGPLRRAAEDELRACARMAATREERVRWVDEANRTRPMTWI